MSLLQLLILALVQGLTEFIPVSSSAHLILVPYLMHWQDQGPMIDVAAHAGSLIAVLLYFRAETAQLFRGGIDTLTFKQSSDRRLFLFLAAASIPVLLFGAVIALNDWTGYLRNPLIIGVASIFFGVVLWWSDKKPITEAEAPNTWKKVMTIGVAQMLSLIPGTSRSGITMTAARFLGHSREQSARFSMLLAIPTIMAFAAFALLDLARSETAGEWQAGLIVLVLSFISAFAAIALFMRLVEKIGFTPFVLYRVALGIVLIYLALSASGA